MTFETLITFLRIENNILNTHSDPWIKSDRDSIRNSCDVSFKKYYFEIISFDLIFAKSDMALDQEYYFPFLFLASQSEPDGTHNRTGQNLARFRQVSS